MLGSIRKIKSTELSSTKIPLIDSNVYSVLELHSERRVIQHDRFFSSLLDVAVYNHLLQRRSLASWRIYRAGWAAVHFRKEFLAGSLN